jgi:hypothetical protein
MKKIFAIAAMVAMLATGCSTSMITSTWKSSSVTAKPYKRILVLGLIGEPDRTMREKMEQHIAGDLRDLGYNAVCACEAYVPKAFDGVSEKEAVKFLSEEGFDAVITVVLLNKEKERYYTPGRVQYSPYSVQHRRFWGYYTTMHGRVFEPGYYSATTKYFWETNLYDLSDLSLVYSAQSQSFDPESYNKLAHEYGLMIVKNMQKQGVLQLQTAQALKSF